MWQKFERFCTGGAPAMLGSGSGLVTLLKTKIHLQFQRTSLFVDKHWLKERPRIALLLL